MNKISRKGFLKIAAAAAMSGVTAGALAACNSASSSGTAASASGDAVYTPGTYTGTATGIGEVKVTMTFSEDAITDCKITSSGNDDLMKDDLRSSMAAAVVDSQGDTSVDAITSSTLSFSVKAVQEAVADCIAQAKA